MKVHANAALGPKGRLTMVLRVLEQGWSIAEAAAAAGVSGRTCSKWIARYRAEGLAGLVELLGRPLSTVSGILQRIGMGKLGRLGLEPAQRYERERPGELVHIDVKKLGRIQGGAGKRIWGGSTHYNHRRTDKEGRRRNTVGWDYVHIAIDDCTRLAYAEVLGDEKATTAIAFSSGAPPRSLPATGSRCSGC